MNKYDDQLEKIIHQSIQADFQNVPDLQNSKDITWNEISKHLPKTGRGSFTKKPMLWIASLFAVFILAASLTDISSTKALGWIQEFFMVKQDQTLYMGSGSTPVADTNQGIPSPDEAFVVDVVQETLTMTAAEAKEAASFQLLLPTYLPDGYSEKEAVVQCNNDICDNVTLTYVNNDGKELTIQQKHFQGAYGTGRGFRNVVETKEAHINGAEATVVITSHENLKFVVWSHYNTEYLIDAYLSEDEILKVAKSLEMGTVLPFQKLGYCGIESSAC